MFRIRQECPADTAQISQLITSAFLSAPHSDGHEAELTSALRTSPDYVPELAFVLEEVPTSDLTEPEIVGFLMLTRANIPRRNRDPARALILAPLAIRPDRQRQGLGTLLVQPALQQAHTLGYTGVVVLGDPAYYGRFGFRPAADFRLRFLFDVPPEFAMAICWDRSAWADAEGTVIFSQVFLAPLPG